MSAAHNANIARAKALCLMVCARYGVSGASLRMALTACELHPLAALSCYRAIMRSIPKAQYEEEK